MTFVLITLLLTLSWYENCAASMSPVPGECETSFTNIFPPRIMDTWYVIKHTDSIHVRPLPDCLIMTFGRRMNFNSQMRIDIIQADSIHDSKESVDLPPLRGAVTILPEEPFNVSIPLSLYFPKNIMITDFDGDDKCVAFWSCTQIGPTMTQKGAWVLCRSLEVDEDIVENLVQKVSTASNIDPSFFISTKYEACP